MFYDQTILSNIRSKLIAFDGVTIDYDNFLEGIGDAQLVLLGEATHGTDEFYTIRADISKALITKKGFHAIAIEGDWPDAYQLNLYAHQQNYTRAGDALACFDRFPTWMWRNVPILDFICWLEAYNKEQSHGKDIGFYGLDLYSLYRSVDVVIDCLTKIDPEAAREARYHYSCFDTYRHDPQAYAYAVITKAIGSCEPMVIEQLKRMQERDWTSLAHNKMSVDQLFYLEQNAHVIKNAEQYYRSLFTTAAKSWNLRDSHMFQTLQALISHYQAKGIERPKIIIWAHNSHIGNAAATQMGEYGEFNIGQLVKDSFGSDARSIGFTTYEGTVSAASDWHAPVERKQIKKALPESYEALLHAVGIQNFLLFLDDKSIIPHRMLERAIGVVYRPETERESHYFYAQLTNQFDAIIHIDKTTAVEPLEKTGQWIEGEPPETYPSGL